MKKAWPYLLLIILFSVAIRYPTFLTDFVNIDENEYAIAAQKILAGGFPYKDVLIYQPPVIYYIYALGFYITGGIHIWSPQIITIGFIVGTIIALYFLTSGLTGSKKAGLASAIAYGAFSTTFLPQDMLAANCEIMMMLPLTLSVLTLYHAEKKLSPFLYMLAGVFASMGVLTKYQGGSVVAAEGFYILILSAVLTRSFSIKRNLIPSILLTIGFFIPITCMAIYLWLGGALPYAAEALNYIFLYAKGPVQSDFIYVLMKFIARSLLFCLPGIVMWWGAVATIGKYLRSACHPEGVRLKRTTEGSPDKPFISFSILWFFVSIAPIVVGGRIYFHYYFVILPPAALLFGIWWEERGQYIRRPLKALIAIWLIICVTGWTVYSTRKPYRKLGPKDQWVHAASYLKSHSSADETLFIWGYCPQIYIYSGLSAGTRFTTADYLTGRSPMTAGLEYDPNAPHPPSSFQKFVNDFVDPPGVVVFDTSKNIFPKAWQYLKKDFEDRLPTYIIDTASSNYRRYGRYPMAKFPYLLETVRRNYDPVKSAAGFDIYKIKKGVKSGQ